MCLSRIVVNYYCYIGLLFMYLCLNLGEKLLGPSGACTVGACGLRHRQTAWAVRAGTILWRSAGKMTEYEYVFALIPIDYIAFALMAVILIVLLILLFCPCSCSCERPLWFFYGLSVALKCALIL